MKIHNSHIYMCVMASLYYGFCGHKINTSTTAVLCNYTFCSCGKTGGPENVASTQFQSHSFLGMYSSPVSRCTLSPACSNPSWPPWMQGWAPFVSCCLMIQSVKFYSLLGGTGSPLDGMWHLFKYFSSTVLALMGEQLGGNFALELGRLALVVETFSILESLAERPFTVCKVRWLDPDSRPTPHISYECINIYIIQVTRSEIASFFLFFFVCEQMFRLFTV